MFVCVCVCVGGGGVNKMGRLDFFGFSSVIYLTAEVKGNKLLKPCVVQNNRPFSNRQKR